MNRKYLNRIADDIAQQGAGAHINWFSWHSLPSSLAGCIPSDKKERLSADPPQRADSSRL